MATKKKMDLLTAVEQIVDKAKGSGLSSEFYRKADKYIKYMSDSLLITTARNCNRRKHVELGSDCKLFTDGLDVRENVVTLQKVQELWRSIR